MLRRTTMVSIVHSVTLGAFIAGIPGTSWAYNRGTHQHITELGYGYIKLMADQCVPEMIGTPASYQICLANCVGSEIDVTSPSASFDSEANQCINECFSANFLFPRAECNPLAAAAARGIFTSARAAQVASFWRDFSATPCPPLDSDRGGTRYHYYGVEHCERPGTNLTTAARQPLGNWTEAALAYQRVPAEYQPIIGGLLGNTSLTADGTRVDLTGTILGFHGSVVDKLADMYTAVQILPVVNDALKTYAQLLAGIGIGYYGALALYFGACACAFSCPITAFSGTCDNCFSSVWDYANGVFGEIDDTINAIEEFNLLPVAESPTTFDRDNTSMFHFMNIPFQRLNASGSEYDDIDGFNFPRARRGFDQFLTEAHDVWFFDQLADVKVQYPPSRRALMNYQQVSPDDGMTPTDERGVFYWHRYGMANYVFPPIDNLAYYWWHKWLEGRLSDTATTVYGLMPLGGALHAVQDITQPLHAANDITARHSDYENSIQSRLDPASASREPDGPLIFDLTDPTREAALLAAVSFFLVDIQDRVIAQNGGILKIRQLLHYIYDRSVRRPTDDDYTTQVGIPLAIAASIWVLREGSAVDLGPYESQMMLSLASFERKGPVPPINSGGSPGADPPPPGPDIPLGFDAAHPDWVCAASSTRTLSTAENYVAGTATGRDLMVAMLSEKNRCDMEAIGLPVPPLAELDQLASHTVGGYQALSRFLTNGSVGQYQQELACNSIGTAASLLSASERAIVQARCAGTLDSDGDGIPDQRDACITPGTVVGRYSIGINGCAFTHEDIPRMRIDPFKAGTVRQVRMP